MNFNVEVKDLVRAGMWQVIDEEIGRLRDDNARLKAEVARLQAEVERLHNLGIKLDGYVDLVRHENERLRKAGNAMAVCLEAYNRCKPYDGPLTRQCLGDWNAAKEGKPSV